MQEVTLRGDGLALSACAELLRAGGWRVYREGGRRAKLPSVLLNGASQNLLLDVFRKPDLLDGLHPITKRIVRWGNDTISLPHSALAVSEGELLERLGAQEATPGTGAYSVLGTRPLPDGVEDLRFGTRVAEAVPVGFETSAEANACWVEAVEGGWLFAVDAGWMLAVGATAEELLGQSKLVRGVVAEITGERSSFAASPRIAATLAGENWLACGSAAMGFDPLCGEGTGHTVREAILASAVLKAQVRDGHWAELSKLYEQRLRGGFKRHLEQCRLLYASGGKGPWWQSQQQSVQLGLEASRGWVVSAGRFRLEGYELVSLRS
ncbi:MAG: hypothetical protein FJW36_15370 [Acidobacteria bacterium]|nr:hypothetical protein [Acidobacteriota bacterium]